MSLIIPVYFQAWNCWLWLKQVAFPLLSMVTHSLQIHCLSLALTDSDKTNSLGALQHLVILTLVLSCGTLVDYTRHIVRSFLCSWNESMKGFPQAIFSRPQSGSPLVFAISSHVSIDSQSIMLSSVLSFLNGLCLMLDQHSPGRPTVFCPPFASETLTDNWAPCSQILSEVPKYNHNVHIGILMM